MLARELHHRIEILAHPVEPLEVELDELLRFRERDLELSRQGMGALAVDRGEVDRLRPTAHLLGYLVDGYAEDHRCRLPVNVAAGLERRDERRIPRQMRQQPQL